MKNEVDPKPLTLTMSILQNRFLLIALIASATRHAVLATALPSGPVAFVAQNAIWIAVTFNATAIHTVGHPEVANVALFAQITDVARLANATDPIPLECAASGEIALRFRAWTRLATNPIRFPIETFGASFAFGATGILAASFTFAGLFVAFLASTVAIAGFGTANEALKIDNGFVDQQRRFLFPAIVTIGRIVARGAIVRGRALTHFHADGDVVR